MFKGNKVQYYYKRFKDAGSSVDLQDNILHATELEAFTIIILYCFQVPSLALDQQTIGHTLNNGRTNPC